MTMIFSRLALARRLSHLLLLFSRPLSSFSPFWVSSGLRPPARWIETGLPPKEIIEGKQLRQSQTLYDAFAPRSTHSSSSFCPSPARSPVPSSCTSNLNGSRRRTQPQKITYLQAYWFIFILRILQTHSYHHMQDTRVLPLGVWKIFEFASPFCEVWLHRYAINFELEALDCFWPKTAFYRIWIKRHELRLVERGWMSNINQKSNKKTQTYMFCSGNSAATSDPRHNQTTTPLGWNRLLIRCLDPASLQTVRHATSCHKNLK